MTPAATAPALRRAIGPVRATALVVGIIIGASIFVQPSEIAAQVRSIPAIFAVWLVAGALTLCGALLCAELSSAFPSAGGVYAFLKAGFGPATGFLWGWAMFWSMHSGIVAAIAVGLARYVGTFVPLDDTGIRLVAIGAVALVSTVNYVGVRFGSAVQATLTVAKVGALLLVIVLGFVLGARLPQHFQGTTAAAVPEAGNFALALIAGLFAYGGWHMVTYAAEETRDPGRTLPRALVVGTLLVTICYFTVNAVYLYVLPLDTVAASTRVAADAADVLLGGGGATLVGTLVIVSALGALAGVILAGPRAYYAMARDGIVFPWFGATHAVYQTPHRAIVAQALWSAVLVATGSYRFLFRQVVFTEWIFFGLMALGAWRLRARPDYAPTYRMWGFPAVPIAFALACAFVATGRFIAEPRDSLLGVALALSGLPVYYLWARRRAKGPVAS
jgi:APA family basic amino acid/polyamine antiporter